MYNENVLYCKTLKLVSIVFVVAMEEEEALEDVSKVAIERVVEEEIERLRGEYERVGHQRVQVGLGERREEHVAHEELERVHHVADHEHQAHDDHEARDVLDLARRLVATGLDSFAHGLGDH